MASPFSEQNEIMYSRADTREREAAYCRRLQEAALAERRNWLALLNGLPAYAYMEDPGHAVLYANDFFRERFGDPEGRHCHELLPPEAKERGCLAAESLKSMKSRIWEWMHTAPGRIYRVYNYPFPGSEQNPPLVLEVGLDITAQKLTGREREVLTEELRQAFGEIRALRSILPLCSDCRSLLEEYRHRWVADDLNGIHQTALRASLCPECRRRTSPASG